MRYLLSVMCAVAISVSGVWAESGLPKALIIGDSISNGYTPPLQEIMKDKAVVLHHPGNAAHTANGVAKLDEWLGDTQWDVIHFNFGLHDLKYVGADGKNAKTREEGHIQIPVEEYKKNLETIVARLKKTGAKLIFATTTPFTKELTTSVRDVEQVAIYNAAALEVMKANAIAIDDLHDFILPKLGTLQNPRDVHFTKEGSKALAEEVAKSIELALSEKATGGKP